MQVRRPHPRPAVVQVDRHAALALVVLTAGPKRDRPEQPARVGMDPGVEVVHLSGEVYEVKLTSVEIKSNETERPAVNVAVPADVDALHKAHIGIEQQRLDAAVGILGGSGSPHVRDADNALEISDR
jgi:hypothetical protein